MELISLKSISKDSRLEILKELGFEVDKQSFVIDSTGKRVVDKYIDKEVRFDSMIILPGSTIILDDNPLSISLYLEEFGDVI